MKKIDFFMNKIIKLNHILLMNKIINNNNQYGFKT